MNDQKVTPIDVLITLAVGLVLALALEAPQALRSATGGAPTAVPRRGVATPAASAEPSPTDWVLTDPRLDLHAVSPEVLGRQPLVREVEDRLAAADVGGLVAWLPPGDASFEVWDFAEREPPLVAGPLAAAVLLDGLFTRSDPAPRVVGWFGQTPSGLDTRGPVHLGVVTCCWRREAALAPSPAGWLLGGEGDRPVFRQWVWLGAPGDGATVLDLVNTWAASGEWDEPAGDGAAPPIPFTRVLWDDSADG